MMFDNSSHLAYRLAWVDRHTIRTDRTDVGLRRPQTNWHETSDRFGTQLIRAFGITREPFRWWSCRTDAGLRP